MKRLVSTIRLDVLLQQRYGLFYAAAFSALVWIAILRALPSHILHIAVPFIIFVDLAIVGFYFIAGMVLFEKDEATLFALVVTPLRFWEYITSKLLTLTILATIVSLLVIITTYGFKFNLLLALLGTVFMSFIALSIGFIAVSPFTSLSNYLIPSQVYAIVLYLPLIYYFGWWKNPIFYVLPTQGSLILLRGAFDPIASWQITYAVLYGIFWVVILAWFARRAFNRYIVAREGVK